MRLDKAVRYKTQYTFTMDEDEVRLIFNILNRLATTEAEDKYGCTSQESAKIEDVFSVVQKALLDHGE